MARCSIRSTVEAGGVTLTRAGFGSISPASRAISGGMVAEKNSVCRFLGQARDDLPDVVDEAHVEHAVGLVEDEDFDPVESDGAVLHEVHETPWRGDEDVDAACEGTDLLAHRHTADGESDAPLEMTGHRSGSFEDLRRQFARRAEHEDAAALRRRTPFAGRETVENRQREGRRLAGPGLGDADQVAPGENNGNRRRLDRRRVGVALVGERTKNGLGKAEVSKLHGNTSAF